MGNVTVAQRSGAAAPMTAAKLLRRRHSLADSSPDNANYGKTVASPLDAGVDSPTDRVMTPCRIFDQDPSSWTDLQDMVGQLFEEMGCKVEIGKTVPNARGAKEIDVYVRDVSITPNAVYLCECKHWARPVPQEIVHAFRTVMADTGAHRGYVISNAGFQSGAYKAAENTNIDLVTFVELQDVFCDRWRISMGEKLAPYTDIFFPYWDPSGGRMPTFKWAREHIERQQKLIEAYQPMLMLRPFSDKRRYEAWFPIILPAIIERGGFEGETIINSYRQLYDFIESSLPIALYHFQVLHGEVKPDRVPGEYDPLLPSEQLS